MFNGRRQPSCGGTSRMTRGCHVRFCERLGVQFPGPTRRRRGNSPPYADFFNIGFSVPTQSSSLVIPTPNAAEESATL